MLITNFNWFLKGTNEKGQKIEISLNQETTNNIISNLYNQAPDTTGICETCQNFQSCITKLFESDCPEYIAKN